MPKTKTLDSEPNALAQTAEQADMAPDRRSPQMAKLFFDEMSNDITWAVREFHHPAIKDLSDQEQLATEVNGRLYNDPRVLGDFRKARSLIQEALTAAADERANKKEAA